MSITRTATLNVRIEPDTKSKAEQVFHNLGISMSDAVNIFLKQVVYRNAIPFELEVPFAPSELDATNWTAERFENEIQKGIIDVAEGNVMKAEDTFNEIREKNYA